MPDAQVAHLFIIIDEFTELKRYSSEHSDVDYIGEVTTIARIGRSLGLHIILISQNIEGAITEDIRVNVKSRLCLKVATRQASKEMIGNDLAARPTMPGNGRAYLLVGTGSRFEYFQSAYSGFGVNADTSERKNEIVLASPSGEYSSFSDLNRHKKGGSSKTQLEIIVKSIQNAYRQVGSGNASDLSQQVVPPHVVFISPIPVEIVYNGSGGFVDLVKKRQQGAEKDEESRPADSEQTAAGEMRSAFRIPTGIYDLPEEARHGLH